MFSQVKKGIKSKGVTKWSFKGLFTSLSVYGISCILLGAFALAYNSTWNWVVIGIMSLWLGLAVLSSTVSKNKGGKQGKKRFVSRDKCIKYLAVFSKVLLLPLIVTLVVDLLIYLDYYTIDGVHSFIYSSSFKLYNSIGKPFIIVGSFIFSYALTLIYFALGWLMEEAGPVNAYIFYSLFLLIVMVLVASPFVLLLLI